MKNTKGLLPGFITEPENSKRIQILLAVLVFLCLSPALLNGFTYWDDHLYVSENPDVRTLSSIPGYFKAYLMGNYHPLVSITYTLEYFIFGLKPWVYILNNILIHILNTLLVYHLIRKYSKSLSVAFIAAFAFGLHPLHVESVVWISERKDVLYTFFLLAGLLSWEKYSESRTLKFGIITFVFYLLSCFSKGQAVVFPFLLILSEVWKSKDFKKIRWLDKIPFFIVSLIFGVIAIYAQGSEGAVKTQNTFKLPDNFLAASWGFIFYLRKMILPWPLSAFYPYPDITKPYPAYFWIMPPLVLLVLWAAWKYRKTAPEWLWAIGFYAASIFLVLQILPVGRALTADRYFYVPSIGLFMALGITLERYFNSHKPQWLRTVLYFVFIAWMGITVYRSTRWKDTETLFRDVLVSFPDESVALNNIATMLAMRKEYDEALKYYLATVRNNPNHIEGVYNIGVLYDETSKYPESVDWFNRVFLMDSAYKDVRQKLALAHNKWGNHLRSENKPQEAIEQFTKAVTYFPEFAEAWSNLGNQMFYLQNYNLAKTYFYKSIKLKPDFAEAWSNLGSLYATSNNLDSAMFCFQKSTEINPEYGPGYFNEGYAWFVKGNQNKAVELFKKSAALGHAPAQNQLRSMGIAE